MNSTDEDDFQAENIGENLYLDYFQRIWQFGEYVDGIWIMAPVAIVGTVVNSFMVSYVFVFWPLTQEAKNKAPIFLM